MTPPGDKVARDTSPAAAAPPAVSSCLTTLRKRSSFLKAARARRQNVKGFVLQARKRNTAEPRGTIGVGFTCSKKVGNAVARNRAKRRLRALARDVLPRHGRAGWDYVLIGKAGATADRAYVDLITDLKFALKKVHS